MASSSKPVSVWFDRREFIEAAAATALLPAASVLPVAPVAAAVAGPDMAGDWHVDDQWSGFPRYSDPIGFGRRKPEPRPAVDPVDEAFAAF